jgi:hypothetical protein
MGIESPRRSAPRGEVIPAHQEASVLSLDPTQEGLLTEAAEALSARVGSILDKVKDALIATPDRSRSEKTQLFTVAAKELWPEHDGHRVKPVFALHSLVPEIQDITVQFEYYNNNGELQRVKGAPGGQIVLGLGALLEARSEDEFEAAREDLIDAIYHETEHITYWGSDIDATESVEAAVQYLTTEGEIRAFAKQYAFRYSRLFPDEPFDLEKMRTLSGVRGVMNYFDSFADPAKQEKYRGVADVKHAHEQIVTLTAQGVEYLNARRSL